MYLTLRVRVQASAQRKGFADECFAGPAMVLGTQGLKQVASVTPAHPLAVPHP